jgi:hypothetical protein
MGSKLIHLLEVYVISLKRFRYITLLLILSLSPSLFGQAVNATLLGTVTDSTGATVSGAKVTATETATGLIHESVTNESGNYTFPDMPPGKYSITAEAKGFKKDTHQNIDLLSNSSTRIDVAMVTGSVSEEVLVTTAPALLQTDRADISTKIEAKQVSELPLGTNRNFQSLLNLVPGMAPATFQHSQFFNAASSLQTEANGLPRMGNLYQTVPSMPNRTSRRVRSGTCLTTTTGAASAVPSSKTSFSSSATTLGRRTTRGSQTRLRFPTRVITRQMRKALSI